MSAPGRFGDPATHMDEGSLLVYPELILEGRVPHRDFESVYGPGNLWVLSGVYAIAGPSLAVERSVGLLYRVAIVLAMFALARSWGLVLAAAAGFLSAVALLPVLGLAALPWVGGVALATTGLWLGSTGIGRSSPSRLPIVAGGLLASLSLTFRPDLLGAVGASGVVVFLSLAQDRRRDYMVGAGLGVVPWIVHVLVATPSGVVNGMLLAGLQQASGRRLPLPALSSEVGRLFLLTAASTAFLLATAGIVVWRERSDRRRARILLAAALFTAGLTPQLLYRADDVHVAYVASVALALLPVGLFVAGRRLLPGLSATALSASVVVLSVAAVALASPSWTVRQLAAETRWLLDREDRLRTMVRHHGRALPVHPGLAPSLEQMLEEVDARTSPGDRVFVGPADLRFTYYNDTVLYYLLPQLEPATYFLEMSPGRANRPGSRLASDLASARLAVLTHLYDGWNEPNQSSVAGSSEPMRVLHERFCLVEQFGPWELWERCS